MNNPVTLIHSCVLFLFITGFSIYDIIKHRVPDKALLLFLPFTLTAPLAQHICLLEGTLTTKYLTSLCGAGAGFLILLAAALFSKNCEGIGGGDIKLAAMLGFIFGMTDIIAILMIATLLAMPVCLFRKRHVPFVPFMFIGVLITQVIELIYL